MSDRLNHDCAVRTLIFEDDGETPNHPKWPALVYHGIFDPEIVHDVAAAFEAQYAQFDWGGMWRFGVFDFHHFHSNAHEVLGVARGRADLVLGGRYGRTVSVTAGDALILPAGTGHRNADSSSDFLVCGAYPAGADKDLIRSGEGDIDHWRERIAAVPRPDSDPIFGEDTGLVKHWER